ncbi:MAG: hypothetical protein RMK64_06275 [Rhodovarius sp.]|nr:hypothetical protein [Rhodovarius sp.]MDW8314559.1 hypothetical protein [Rhodovarius sp.]
MAWPLAFELPLSILLGSSRGLLGALAGLVLLALAAQRIWRGRYGDRHRAAVLVGVAAGLIGALCAGIFAPIAAVFGLGAYAGARLLFDDVPEAVPPPGPARADAPSPPPSAPFEEAAARLLRIRTQAPSLPLAGALISAADALEALRLDLLPRQDPPPEARRFLLTSLEGLERIQARLAAGAEPPASLPPLLAEMAATAHAWRERLRRLETEALDIHIKVLSDRLRERRP